MVRNPFGIIFCIIHQWVYLSDDLIRGIKDRNKSDLENGDEELFLRQLKKDVDEAKCGGDKNEMLSLGRLLRRDMELHDGQFRRQRCQELIDHLRGKT